MENRKLKKYTILTAKNYNETILALDAKLAICKAFNLKAPKDIGYLVCIKTKGKEDVFVSGEQACLIAGYEIQRKKEKK